MALWEALYGRRPFSGATYAKVMDNVTNGRRARIDARDPQTRRVPSWLRSVCQRGIAVEPERRYRSMEELLAALSHGRARARTRRWLAGAAAVALAGASGLAYQAYDRATRVAACEDEGGLCVDSGDATFTDGKQSTSKDRKKRSKKTAGTLSVSIDGGRGSVFLNGRFVGTAPVSGVELPSGKNDIHVRDGATVLANGLLDVPKGAAVSVTVRHD